jgi:hypothetical protein
MILRMNKYLLSLFVLFPTILFAQQKKGYIGVDICLSKPIDYHPSIEGSLSGNLPLVKDAIYFGFGAV